MINLKLALYGDSMTEYLHTPPRILAALLQERRPDLTFDLLNYGVGATRAELVLYRLRYEFWHGRQRMLPLPVLQPDVVVLESCAFNNSNDQQAGIDNFARIWDEIYDTCRQLAPQARFIPVLTIPSSPQPPAEKANRLFFHAGPEIFANRHHWREIYQQRFIEWITDHSLPLVNLRRAVLDMESRGTPRMNWIAADGVHPNPAGVELISTAIADAVSAAFTTPLETA